MWYSAALLYFWGCYSADTTVQSQQELDLLFGPLYDEFFNDGAYRINKSSSPTDNSVPQDTHPSTNIQPTSKPSTPTNAHVLRKTTLIKQNLSILSVHRYKKLLSLPHAILVIQMCIPSINLKNQNNSSLWKSIQASANKMTTCNIS
ncbi:hypothetical protein Tco_0193212 [Tanacetum coccineum]